MMPRANDQKLGRLVRVKAKQDLLLQPEASDRVYAGVDETASAAVTRAFQEAWVDRLFETPRDPDAPVDRWNRWMEWPNHRQRPRRSR